MMGSMLRRASLGDGSTLSLDFTTGTMPSGVTFTRAANTATYINASGYVTTINADLPRLDYDQTTLASRGLLVEGTGINLALRSNDFNTTVSDGTSWAASGYTRGNVSTTLPDGTTGNACQISTASGSGSFRSATITVTASTAYTWSFWARNNGGSQARYRVWNATAGSSIVDYTLSGSNYVSQIGGANNTSSTWVRVSVSFTTPAGCTSIFVYPASSDSGTVDLLVWGAQVETGGMSSYIPTTSSTVTRNPDICTVSGSDFSSWFNATEGTIYVEGRRRRTDNTSAFVSINDDTNNEIMEVSASTTGQFNVTDVTSQAALTRSGFSANTDTKLAAAFKLNDCNLAMSNSVATADTSCTIPTVDRMYIGRTRATTAVYLDGHVRLVKFWPTRQTDSEIQGRTA